MQYKTKRTRGEQKKNEQKALKGNAHFQVVCLSISFAPLCAHTIVEQSPASCAESCSNPQSSPHCHSHSHSRSVLSCLPQVAHFLVALFDVIIIEVKS